MSHEGKVGNCTLVVTPSERLVRHSSYTEEKRWSLQALTEEMKCNLVLATFLFSFVYFTLLSCIIIFPLFYAFPFLLILHIT